MSLVRSTVSRAVLYLFNSIIVDYGVSATRVCLRIWVTSYKGDYCLNGLATNYQAG